MADSSSSSFNFNNLGQASTDDAEPPLHSPQLNAPPQQDAPLRTSSSRPSTVYQTTGPDAYTKPIEAPDGSGNPALNPRSCVTCRKRKVRCDKQMPCSNCRRAQIPCVFPAPGRAPRQSRPRDPNALPKNGSKREVELVKRLRKLEGIVEELSGQIETESSGKDQSVTGSPDATQPSTTAPPRTASVAQRQLSTNSDLFSPIPKDNESVSDYSGEVARRRETKQQFGRLVLTDQKGSSRRYISSSFWSKLNDELDALREETQRLTDEDTDESDYDGTPHESPTVAAPPRPDHHGFIMGYSSADVDLRQWHPLPSQVPFLWSVFQENVEPLCKILHVPSVDKVIREARKDTTKLSTAEEALVFAIYFGAIISLEPAEVQQNFQTTREALLLQFQFAAEQSLAKAKFLDTSNLMVVQAFTIFLMVVRRQDDSSRFCWALTGLLIRIAQGIGLHRDGTHFDLSPFETEMKRRLWWVILILDLRSSEELGTDLTIGEHSFDTEMPANINDSEIDPSTTTYPETREGTSDCAVLLVRCEICQLSRRLYSASSAMASMCPNSVSGSSVGDRERTLVETYQRIERKFLRYVRDESDPLYWVASMISRVIMGKMCLVIYQPMLFPGSEQELNEEIRDRIFVAAIEIVEYNHKLNTEPRFKQFRWLFMTYTNWHAIAYVLIEICRRPWTPLCERGWEAVNGYETNPVERAKSTDHAAVFIPLRRLFLKARKHRVQEVARLRANQDDARRLEFEERMNPAQARFGPVPGSETRIQQVRENWRALVRPDASTPLTIHTESNAEQRYPVPAYAPLETASPMPISSMPSNPPMTTNSNPANPGINQAKYNDAAMDYMTGLMSKRDTDMTNFWDMNAMGLMDPLNQGEPTTSSTGATATPAVAQADSALRQQAINMTMQPPREQDLPPYLWSDPFTSVNAKLNDGAADLDMDMDMLGGDFDWQDWSQSIRGLEMETPQPQMGW